jgi:SAM-dependent methyltransferase
MNDRERWDARFAQDAYVFGTEPNRFLEREAHRLPAGARVLAVADGEGRNGVWLAQQGFRVTAFDVAPNAQAKAARLASERGVPLDFRLADVVSWAWEPDAFDAVAAIFVQFAPPPLRAAMFEGMRHTTRPGGLVLLQGYRPEQIAYGTGGPPDPAFLYTEAMLRDAFAGWSVESLHVHDSEISEGAGHRGMSALIDLVARKPG